MFWDQLSRRKNVDFLFGSDIVNPLLKTKGERERRPNYVNLVFWSALRLVSGGHRCFETRCNKGLF